MGDRYRLLEKGEVIRSTDEADVCRDGWRDPPVWRKAAAHMIGRKVSDPAYPSHTKYRRALIDIKDKEEHPDLCNDEPSCCKPELERRIAELEARVKQMRLGGCRGCRELETWHICGKQPDALLGKESEDE